MARRALDEAVPGLGRAGRRLPGRLPARGAAGLERALLSGELLGLASTNALELGVDLVGLDAVLICGYPGTRASLWQQAGPGRAGPAARRSRVLVARDDPLDTYLVHHPEALFGRPVEATVLDPANPYVLGPQLCCAAAEAPLTPADLALFGGGRRAAAVDGAGRGRGAAAAARPAGTGPHRGRPEVDLRGTGGAPVCGRRGGDRPAARHGRRRARRTSCCTTGAVYLHQGVVLRGRRPGPRGRGARWCTPRSRTGPPTPATSPTSSVVAVRSYVDAGPVGLFLGEVDVTSQVVSYQRRRHRHRRGDRHPAAGPAGTRAAHGRGLVHHLAARRWPTPASSSPTCPGALHAAEHAAIGLLPLMATCDRWDIGGLSTAVPPGHRRADGLRLRRAPGRRRLRRAGVRHGGARGCGATRDAIAACGCETGCPSCVQSPKCGNGNNPLAKGAAVAVLDSCSRHLPLSESGGLPY